MPLTQRSFSADRTKRKFDIAQVSLSLQDRLGLAKVKYQNDFLQALGLKQDDSLRFGSDRPSDSSSEICHSGYDTPLTSPAPQSAVYSKELPRSVRNKHAATFDVRVMEPMLSATRKRLRSDPATERPSKAPRTSWKSSHRLPESSPGFNRHSGNRNHHLSVISDNALLPELSSPAYRGQSDEENDPHPTSHSVGTLSSMISSSPPRTPPQRHLRPVQNERTLRNEDGADLLLFLANSPTPARVANKSDFPPSTPPSQHAVLRSLTPTPAGGLFANFGTPTQQFNFADFVNVTPSPAQPAWGSRTPGNPTRTPLAIKGTRKKLNFDNLAPPSTETSKLGATETGLALQLGGELRP